MIRFFSLTVLALGLAGCAHPKNVVLPSPSPEGQLSIMGAGLNFNLNAPPEDWLIVIGDKKSNPKANFSPLTSVSQDGVNALEIRSGPSQMIAVRKVQAMLMATPFLKWDWHLSDHGQGIHPVRIVIGFKGDAGDGTIKQRSGGGLPDHDRALALVWGDTALRRGTLNVPDPNKPHLAAVYTVRGGRENTRKWWRDTVDLSELYRQAWPYDERRTIRITFIGIAAAPHTPPIRGRVSGIELTH